MVMLTHDKVVQTPVTFLPLFSESDVGGLLLSPCALQADRCYGWGGTTISDPAPGQYKDETCSENRR